MTDTVEPWPKECGGKRQARREGARWVNGDREGKKGKGKEGMGWVKVGHERQGRDEHVRQRGRGGCKREKGESEKGKEGWGV